MLIALYGCVASVVVAIGVLSLLGASWPRQMLESWINIHALFKLLLCGLVFARCRCCVGHSLRTLSADIRGLSRHLSRIVYLILYVVIGVTEIIGILNSLWHGGAVDYNLFGDHIRDGPDHASWDPDDDFQLFFAAGLFALLVVRVLAYRLWLRSRERGAVSKAPAGIDLGRIKDCKAVTIALAKARRVPLADDRCVGNLGARGDGHPAGELRDAVYCKSCTEQSLGWSLEALPIYDAIARLKKPGALAGGRRCRLGARHGYQPIGARSVRRPYRCRFCPEACRWGSPSAFDQRQWSSKTQFAATEPCSYS
jgi:cytochrome b561